MPEHPITPVAITRYDTVSQRAELFDGPDAVPYRFNWRAVHGTQLAADFKLALKKLEGLMYVMWGSQPDYAGGKQWYTREHPRCRWGAEQWWEQPNDNPPPQGFWNFLETAALGQLYSGVMPTPPVRSRSGDPRAQFKRAQHSDYFPFGSVERDLGHQVFDPASTFKQFAAWPDAEDVTVRYTVPEGKTATAVMLVTSLGSVAMTEVSPGAWEAAIEAQTQGTWVDWYIAAEFANDPGKTHYDPYVGESAGGEIAPTLAGAVADPEHGRAPNAAYSFVFYSHYNPYAGGLPELLDENEPHEAGNWLRRGTDGYQFDSSENIQPGLINLARFVLDTIGAQVQHHPGSRGDSELCCQHMPIVWRWSGANQPDLYRGGGKGGAAGSSPLHNHPTHGNAGSVDARKSWRGIEMAWRGAGDVPGFFADNWWYGDTESWLAWPEKLTLDPDPLNPPFLAIMRSYASRGLRAGDAIDPVYLLEIIDAVNYLISNGLVVQVPIHTAPRTPSLDDVWNTPCGQVHYWGNTTYPPPDDQWDYTEIDVNGLCCKAIGPPPDYACDPWDKPSWAECQGGSKCYIGRSYLKICNTYTWDTGVTNIEWVSCNVSNPNGFWTIYTNYNGHEYGGWLYNSWDPKGPHGGLEEIIALDDDPRDCRACECPNEGTESAQYGASYWLCGPDQSWRGPDGDNLHGNGFMKPREDAQGNFSYTGPSMGNRFASGSVYACATPGINEPTPDFQTVTGVVDHGNAGAWYKHDPCVLGRWPDYAPPPPIPGLGLWNYDNTSSLYTLTKAPVTGCEQYNAQSLVADVGVQDFGGCNPDQVYVRIDLNLQGGIPTLYHYNLGIADPYDDCPCKTWTGPSFCE